MAKKRVRNIRGKVLRNIEKQKRDSSFSYLVLPKDLEIFNPDKGRIMFDVLPYVVKDENHPDREEEFNIAIDGEEWYRRPFTIHRNIGPDNDVAVCPGSIGEKCPICEYRKKLSTEADTEDEVKALWKDTKPRVIYLVVPVDAKKWDEVVYIYDNSPHVFQKKLNDELEDKPEYEVFYDPTEEGYTLNVRYTKESTGKYTYSDPSRIDFEKREKGFDEYPDEFIDNLPNLDDIIKDSVMPYKELEKKFLAYVDDDDDEMEEPPEDDDDDERSSGRSRKPRRGHRTPQEEDNDQDDEPEKEKKPASRSRGTSRSKDKCPHGHKFGTDTDEYDDCEKCKVWDECNEANPET
jgi:hypothetical protein